MISGRRTVFAGYSDKGYATIQEAVAHAMGVTDIIKVGYGVHVLDMTLDLPEGLTLEGEGKHSTVIVGPALGAS